MKEQLKPFIDRFYAEDVHQITIDLVQLVVEELTDDSTKDEIGSAAYHVENLVEVMNPEFEEEISILKGIADVLNVWEKII